MVGCMSRAARAYKPRSTRISPTHIYLMGHRSRRSTRAHRASQTSAPVDNQQRAGCASNRPEIAFRGAWRIARHNEMNVAGFSVSARASNGTPASVRTINCAADSPLSNKQRRIRTIASERYFVRSTGDPKLLKSGAASTKPTSVRRCVAASIVRVRTLPWGAGASGGCRSEVNGPPVITITYTGA
jgi:hypothetical protein